MSVVYKENTVSKIQIGGNRVLQRRRTDAVLFNDADIKISVTVNKSDRTTVGSLIVTFNKSLDIIANYGIGANSKIFKKVTGTSITKSFNINEDNNGAGNGSNLEEFSDNFFYLSAFDVTSITIGRTSDGIQTTTLQLLTLLPNLLTYVNSIPQSPDFTFLNSVPSVINLDFMAGTQNTWNNGYASLKNSNLKALVVRGYNGANTPLINNLPNSLYYFRCVQLEGLQVDLKDFFTGNRVGFVSIGASIGGPVNRISYSGGAVFPSVLTESVQSVDYILYQSSNVPNKITGDEFAQWLIDFANQVTAINLATKRITVQGTSPNTSYTDNSKPLFKTYTAARNHVVNTLGIILTTA